MPRRPPSVTRRTTVGATLVGLAGLGVLSGCDLDDLDPRSDPADPDGPAVSAPPEDADTVLVASVVVDLTATLAAVRALPATDRAGFRPLVRLHRRHLAELDAPAEEPATPSDSPTTAPVAAAEVVRQEQRLQRRLVTAAVAAESGELARVLGSMSAAVAQQLAVR
ncbi:hypothetical protein [Nocardioides lianchengensis]|uniref:DUF4439 domain-containing protein n=1 Tax=Nocardioides lianchengensis TaxID=1045774 RepID=A0A1G6N3Z4_9ACTN|nr:hypothetical protein [Nocardioides lianchengensis]NYG10648.1 hypothetical protein [Nocardioides lianchengensis]SDC62559.1 hypothetical protein SAMN05421872_103133 [Nocardioides lianchengensis]